ncbi:sensor domain-containing diguanylate cyclase [Bacillus sp. 1NLA3E]|uniref:sensor domain-containing diguanylate cyclase n=1 Tax=Bacillus sp. 1NLA3E TaxID=666686 RepID=UPI0002F7C019|nr:sensor domain-containing diguanylate cyclase [Bacillus sp. 1NLA3E]AGK55222.1 signal transduction diguanylate cyclase (GAF-GAF-GGDEF domains) [Bacillus sp. 1NLA3E]
MKMRKKDVLAHLKSQFLDILDEENGFLHFENTLKKMLLEIKEILSAQEVLFFFFSDWKEKLLVDGILIEESSLLSELPFNPESYPLHKSSLPKGYIVSNGMDSLGYLAINGYNTELISTKILVEVSKQCGIFIKKVHGLSKMALKEKKYRLLFSVTEKFHSSMDMDSVLEEMILVLKKVYHGFTFALLLSQDSHSKSLPIEGLKYNSENLAAMQSYVTGTVQIEDHLSENCSILYAPLKGKQGVYGVLQITALNTNIFPKNEVEFISLLTNTAGNAFENAQLYQQSKQLIEDLQLINEVSHRLNSKLRITDTVTYMCKQIVTSFEAQEVGFILFSDEQKKVNILEGSTSFFLAEKAELYIQYFNDQLQMEKDALFIGDFKLLNDKQFRSIMAVPMIQTGVMQGFILVMHENPYYFSFESYKLLQSLIHHSTLAFVNSSLKEELERMVITDYLTKLYSRNYLDQKIQQSMKDDGQGTFILIDIDNFKGVNDTFGHQVGDEVIIQVANVMSASIRASDIGARWGGEELAIYLPRITMEKGRDIARRLVERVKQDTNPPVTVSCGISNWNKMQKDTVKDLFVRADQALYVAKNSGKNKVVTQNEMTI